MYGQSKTIPSVSGATVHLSHSKRSTVKKVKFSLRNALNIFLSYVYV